MSISTKCLLANGYTIGADGGWYKGVAPVAPIPNPIPKPNPQHGGGGPHPVKAPDPARRLRVCITSHRRRLLDPDNLFVKWVVDGLRYAKVIPDDSSKHIELIVKQEQVKHKHQEKTSIDVTPIE